MFESNVAYVDYEKAFKENNVKFDSKKALSIILDDTCGDGTTITIQPKALNALLKALESINAVDRVVILPYLRGNDIYYLLVKCSFTVSEVI